MKKIGAFILILIFVFGCSSGGSNNSVAPPTPIPTPIPEPIPDPEPLPPTKGSVTLMWDASPPEENVEGYRVCYGTESGVYTSYVQVGAADTSLRIEGFDRGMRYYFACKSFRGEEESNFSDEVYVDL